MRTLLLIIILFILTAWARDTPLFWPIAILYALVISSVGAGVRIGQDAKDEKEEIRRQQDEANERWREVLERSDKDKAKFDE